MVRRAKTGDPAAQAQLLEAHAARAYHVSLHVLGNKSDAEDATQNAFVKTLTQLGRFEERSSFGTWLLRIVTREALNLRRSERTRFAYWRRHGNIQEGEETVESIVQVKAEHRDLWRAVNRLQTDDRMVLTLTYFMEMSESDAAATLGIKQGTVKSRKHNAIKRLRAIVEREFPGLGDVTIGQQEPKGTSL